MMTKVAPDHAASNGSLVPQQQGKAAERRSLLKSLAFAATVAPAIGHWAQSQAQIHALLSASIFSDDQESTLVSAVDTLLPKTGQWGAVELGVPLYLLKYFSLCIEEDQQQLVVSQLQGLNAKAMQKYQKTFFTCERAHRETLLNVLANSANENDKRFFGLLKSQSIHGFRNTKEVTTGPYRYQIAPGHFNGCLPIDSPAVT